MGLEALYTQCAAQRQANEGKLPVVEYKGSRLEKIGRGTTRIPSFEIVNWIARPEGMGAPAAAVDEEEYVAAPAPAPAVARAPAKAAAPAEDEMF
jgi:hypothetical protein